MNVLSGESEQLLSEKGEPEQEAPPGRESPLPRLASNYCAVDP